MNDKQQVAIQIKHRNGKRTTGWEVHCSECGTQITGAADRVMARRFAASHGQQIHLLDEVSYPGAFG